MICPECGNECDIIKIEERDRSAIRERYFCQKCSFLYGDVQSLRQTAKTEVIE